MAPHNSLTTTRAINLLSGFALLGAAASIFFQQSPGGCGDYPQNFSVLWIGLACGAALSVPILVFYHRIRNAFLFQSAVVTLIRYFVAFLLFGYGISKVFAAQFPHLMANMDARFIELSPMRVAWAFFGYSKGYQMFLGWSEVIPAIMLLFRRTALFGALLMFIVLLNVFLINIFFDVCVKLNSGIYASLSLYLLLQHIDRFWKFFFTGQQVPARLAASFHYPKWLRISALVVNVLLVSAILVLSGLDAWDTYHFSKTHVTTTPVQGAWRVHTVKKWSDSTWSTSRKATRLPQTGCFSTDTMVLFEVICGEIAFGSL